MWVPLTKGATKTVVNGAAVTRIQSAWIPSSGLAYPETTSIRVYGTSCLKGLRGTDASMFALDHEGNLKMVINHMETTAVSGKEVIGETHDPRQICFGIVWKPDIDLMSHEQIVSYCKANNPDVAGPTSFYEDLGSILYHYIERTLKKVQHHDVMYPKPHIRKYVAWLKMQASKSTSRMRPYSRLDQTSRTRDSNELEGMVSRVKDANAEGKFLVAVGRNLESIVRGVSDPLEIMFRDGLVNAHYQEVCDKTSSCRQLRSFLDLFAHKNPSMKIIEVGAGTGSITNHILEPLQLHGGMYRFAQYDYTDISESFFEHAQKRFASAKTKITSRP